MSDEAEPDWVAGYAADGAANGFVDRSAKYPGLSADARVAYLADRAVELAVAGEAQQDITARAMTTDGVPPSHMREALAAASLRRENEATAEAEHEAGL